VIAAAIRQYQADFDTRITYGHDELTIVGRLERIIKIQSRNIQIRPYTTAIMAVYNSPTADRAIRTAIRDVAYASIRPWADHLQRRRQFSDGCTTEAFIALSATVVYAVITDWCMGDIPDDAFVDRMAAAQLVLLSGTTRGETRREVRAWLHALNTGAPEWLDLKRLAQVTAADVEPHEPAR
jgi:hypothetical protein